MSNLSDDTLRKILNQIQQQAITSQRSHAQVRAQIQSKEKERKILDLTRRELGSFPSDGTTMMYKGVGKMFIQQDRSAITSEHDKLDKTLNEDITNLDKKSKYFAKQAEEASNQLKDIFHSQAREQQ